ncbi:MAG: hypothetical protein AB1547_15205 [Thermodesulfobacteriota bacterium]
MNVQDTRKVDWEAFFENATEDVSGYDAALADVETAAFGPESGYDLIQALADRSRCMQALAILERAVLPEDFRIYRLKLDRRFRLIEDRWNRMLDEHLPEIARMFEPAGACAKPLEALDRELALLLRSLQDWFLFHDPEEAVEADLEDRTLDVLLPFSDCFRAATDSPPKLSDHPSFRQWCRRFQESEARLRTDYGYLEPVGHILQRFREREYNADFWWLIQPPLLADVTEAAAETPLPEAMLQAALSRLHHAQPGRSCPDIELVTAYALRALQGSDHRTVGSHVHSCPYCLNVVMDMRGADPRVPQEERPEIDWASYRRMVLKNPRIPLGVDITERPTKAVYERLQYRFGALMEFPPSLLQTAHSLLEALFIAPFRSEALPLTASDLCPKPLIGKCITIGPDDIAEIQPVTIGVLNLHESDGSIEISAELPRAFESVDPLEILFGWVVTENGIRSVDPEILQRDGVHVVARIGKPSPDLGIDALRIVLIRWG